MKTKLLLFPILFWCAASMERNEWILPTYPFDEQTVWLTNYNREIPLGLELTSFISADLTVRLEIDGDVSFDSRKIRLEPYRPVLVENIAPQVGNHTLVWHVKDVGSGREETLTTHFAVRESRYPDVLPQGMKRRTELGYYLNAHGLVGKGVEVGVKAGEFSEVILERWKGEVLYLVDPWTHQGDEYVDVYGNADQNQQNVFMQVLLIIVAFLLTSHFLDDHGSTPAFWGPL